MLPVVNISDIKARSEAIGVSLKALCRKAGVDPNTAYKAARGQSDTRRATLQRLCNQLAIEEARVAAHIDTLRKTGDAA